VRTGIISLINIQIILKKSRNGFIIKTDSWFNIKSEICFFICAKTSADNWYLDRITTGLARLILKRKQPGISGKQTSRGGRISWLIFKQERLIMKAP
jgi:hypothetical protein